MTVQAAIAVDYSNPENFPHVGEVGYVPVKLIRPYKGQPRDCFDEEVVLSTGKSIQSVGQQIPVNVHEVKNDPPHRWQLIDGETRWRGCLVTGTQYICILVKEPFENELDLHHVSFVSNFNRTGLTPMQISNALYRQKTENGKTGRELAEAAGEDEMWVSNHLALQKLVPELQEMLNPKLPRRQRLSRTAGVLLARMTAETQVATMKKARSPDGVVRIDALRLVCGGEGCITKGRPQKPSDGAAILRNFVDRTYRGVERCMDMKNIVFKSMVQNMDGHDLNILLRCLEVSIAGITEVKESLINARKKE